MKIGIAFSGGGVRGAAHIGILQALQQHDIYPDMVSGTSAGSIVAALYACGYGPHEMKAISKTFTENLMDPDYFGIVMNYFLKKPFSGFLKGKKIEKLLEKYCSIPFKKAKKPLAITACNINTAQEYIFVSKKVAGPLPKDWVIVSGDVKISEAVRASIAIPGVFKPKIIMGERLVDGGIVDNVPAQILRHMGADKVIAINLGYDGADRAFVDNIAEIIWQSLEIMMYEVAKCKSCNADYIIFPNVNSARLLDFKAISNCIEQGYKSTLEIIQPLKEALKQVI